MGETDSSGGVATQARSIGPGALDSKYRLKSRAAHAPLILCAPANGNGCGAEASAEEGIERQDRAGCRSDPRGRAEALQSHWARRVRRFTAPAAVHESACGDEDSDGLPADLTIEETAELVTAAGGGGIAVRVDHTKPADVKRLVAASKRRHQGLDITGQ